MDRRAANGGRIERGFAATLIGATAVPDTAPSTAVVERCYRKRFDTASQPAAQGSTSSPFKGEAGRGMGQRDASLRLPHKLSS